MFEKEEQKTDRQLDNVPESAPQKPILDDPFKEDEKLPTPKEIPQPKETPQKPIIPFGPKDKEKSFSSLELERKPTSPPGSKKKLIILISALVLIGLLIAGVAYTLLTDFKYKLPFFRAKESELVGKMYDRLKTLSGADFSLSFSLNIGKREKNFSYENKKSLLFGEIPEALAQVTLYSIEETIKVNKSINDPTINLGNVPTVDFLSGEFYKDYFLDMEETIPEDIEANLTFTGNGFSLSKEDGSLPNIELALKGQGKFGGLTISLDLAGKLVDDNIYYKVDEFPYVDLTQGHQGEWIKESIDDSFAAEMMPWYEKQQENIFKWITFFFEESAKHKVLNFEQTSKKIKVNNIEAPQFKTTVNAANLITLLESIEEESENINLPISLLNKNDLTDEKRKELITTINNVMENVSIKVALHPATGDLMNINSATRILPPKESKKFGDKQFNSILDLKMWNHGKPSKVKIPSTFVNKDEIKREKLGLSKEAYQDRKQAKRVVTIRTALANYYKEHKSYPQTLSKVTRVDKDVNSGKPYVYEVTNNNYTLEYNMNDVEQEPKSQENTGSSIFGLSLASPKKIGMGTNELTRKIDEWQKGKNITDRFSPIADQMKGKKDYLTDQASENTNHNVLMAIKQAEIVKTAKDQLKSYFRAQSEFPDNIEQLNSTLTGYYNRKDYYCENIIENKVCDYQVGDDKLSYEFKITYNLSYDQIKASSISSVSYRIEKGFTQGENIITGQQKPASYQNSKDTDNDGLSDISEQLIGSDPNKKDTDGDGYQDDEEYYNGYNVLGSGKSTIGAWSECVDPATYNTCGEYCKSLDKTCTNDGITSRGISGFGTEAWGYADLCLSNKNVSGQTSCSAKISGDDRWKCFCK